PNLPTLPQFLILGAMLGTGGFIVNGLVGVFASGIGQKLLQSDRFERGVRWASATVFGALALRLSVMRQG
ncbi:MAG: LysE family translocator, partial [Pseudoruegeria sp.]